MTAPIKLTRDEIRLRAEEELYTFAVLMNPHRVYGDEHRQFFRWLQNDDLAQLGLLPRSHMKSHCIAVWVAWKITRQPWTTCMYVSATEALALQQLYAIKMMLESDVYRRYWPDMLNQDEAKREKWSASEIKVDHPLRKEHGVRDATVIARSVGSNTTGLHCDVLVFDDIVVPDNAYTEIGRQAVAQAYSQFNSIANPGAVIKAVGTRYHPKDIYSMWMTAEQELFDDAGNIIGSAKTWEVYEKAVHDENGVFLWPREQHPKTKQWYGFGPAVLAKIRSAYFSMGEQAQYFAQYFNNPNDSTSNRVDGGKFQYYAREKLTQRHGVWYYAGRELRVFAAADFAFTTGNRSDYTAFAVVGVDDENFTYILDLDQFKTDKYEDYYQAAFRLKSKWGFKKIRVEVNAGANVIATYLKDRLRQEGIVLTVDVANKTQAKVERTAMVLEPAYEQGLVWHFKGGFINEFEEQLLLARPSHDDLRDAVTMAMEIAKPASGLRTRQRSKVVPINNRFGGLRR